ncbi:TIGR01777 family oxidoreductase [Paenibacillus ginsengarvi]|uniref:TIGR01777 family protein n=1 Tax=Paenibacillus ginsengarvi TaxID=400777 RepID=A0A3B0CND8_9BACL|nr:TIGR01777 family oxidoreductase [Paenibacillus ginsengarvi]RKN86248.1 TIGR01777 family protein [Paenibacillus ginsengarvi]
MNRKVVLAGGTGFIGNYFKRSFEARGYEVRIISRKPGNIAWSNVHAIAEALEGAELLMNLAGKSVNCRYNPSNKDEIVNSRTETTLQLGKALLLCNNPPPLWINSSTATIYRHAEDRAMTEEHGEIGTGFSVEVAKAWENAFFSFTLPKTRQAALRIAIVLGKDGGVLNPFKNLVAFGLGGAQGPGNQMFSWIHVEDLFRIVLFIMEHKELEGIINCASPHPVTNRELMSEMRSVLNKKFGLPSPRWLLEIGALVIRTETELLLKSRWVIPERLQRHGFAFQFSHIQGAIQDICK